MDSKLKKVAKIAAATIFVLALAINVKVTLDDPFIGANNLVMAQDTGTSTEDCPGGSCSYTKYFAGKPQGKFTACYPSGETPKCDSFGCTCT